MRKPSTIRELFNIVEYFSWVQADVEASENNISYLFVNTSAAHLG